MHPHLTSARAAASLAVLAAFSVVPLASSATHEDAPTGKLPDNTAAARAAILGGQARNVILFIGDGMGDSEITIARNYHVGAAGRLAMDSLPLTGAYTTYSLTPGTPPVPDYVTDSAASATGWSTGVKTYDGAIGVNVRGKPRPTVLELAQRAGYRTGDVTTAAITDATPAAMVAHVADRSCEGPADMADCPDDDTLAGGAGSIAEQMTDSGVDLFLGGGGARFSQQILSGEFEGKTVREKAVANGYSVIGNADQLDAATGKKPILGLFAPGNMDLEWTGPVPTTEGTIPSTCTPNAGRDEAQPHLSDMTRASLRILSAQTKGAKRGFFLQVEGAQIDKSEHDANPCGQIGETVEFDKSIKLALAYQKTHPKTLIVVTADHGQAAQIVDAGSQTPGVTATLTTHDDAPMTISYATDLPGEVQNHTGTQVHIAAKGPQAANVLGVTNQTDLFGTLKRALGLR